MRPSEFLLRALGISVFFGFLGLQLFITFCPSVASYPFSPYRMFSKNWRDGIVMERIRYQVPGQPELRFPWELLRIPFFQANQLSFVTFLDLKDPGAKAALCGAFDGLRPKVVREDVQYRLKEGRMTETVLRQEVVHDCT